MGGLAAAGSIGGAAIGAHAAGSAADTQIKSAADVARAADEQRIRSDSSYGDILLREPAFVDDARDSAQNEATRGVKDASVILDAERQAAERKAFAERDNATQLTSPYTQAGIKSLADAQGIANGPNFTAANFKELDPGFDFRMAEGQKALERSAFAKGSGISGAVLKDITRYSQDYGSAEFGNAFNRFQSTRQQNYNMAMGIVSAGQTATGQELNAGQDYVNSGTQAGALFAAPQATNAVNLGTRLGDLTVNAAQFNANQDFAVRQAQERAQADAVAMKANAVTGAANARAAGTVGAANAWSGAVQGTTDGITNAILLQNLLKRPTVPLTPNPAIQYPLPPAMPPLYAP